MSMTNAELLATIRAEIERRLKNTRDYMNGAGMKYKGPKYHASRGRESAYDAILSFLYTLESEKPMNQEGLEEEIDRLWESFADEMGGPHNLFDIYARLARHFAQWSAEQARVQMMEEAVEGVVDSEYFGRKVVKPDRKQLDMVLESMNHGDKVHIIIVKED